jgi:hypothetical protein
MLLHGEVEYKKIPEVQFITIDEAKDILKSMMESGFSILNNDKVLPVKFEDLSFDHIIYDEKLDEDNQNPIHCDNEKKHCDYRIIRSCDCDGTFLFLYERIVKCFYPLVMKLTTSKDYEPKIPSKYYVSKIRVETSDVDYRNENDILMTTRFISCICVKIEN